jgi:hypothetical protein
VLALRGYDAAPEEFERMWRWLNESWTTSKAALAPASADTGPQLTAHALDRLIMFWRRFQQEPDSIRATARLARQQQITVPVGTERFSLSVMDTPALAAQYPSVQTALRVAGLTATQADAYRRALIVAAANYAPWPGGPHVPPVAAASRLGRNVAFLQAHKEALKVLGATGMWLTP